jgi:putative DNA primase/helicase
MAEINKTALVDGLAETPMQAAERLTKALTKQGYKLTKLHTYTDAEGNPLFWKSRHEVDSSDPNIRRKQFRFMRLVDNQYEPKAPGGVKPLYNLHRLSRYGDSDVWIVEGEACVDCLTSLKVLATTTGGATTFEGFDFEVLSGRNVILWRDNDAAGETWQAAMQARLDALDCTISIVDIDRLGLSEKADVVDWCSNFEQLHGRKLQRQDVEALPTIQITKELTSTQNNTVDDFNPLASNDADVVVRYLASLSPIKYDQLRKGEAKRLGVQIKTLDSMVKAEREANAHDDSPFTDIEPWQEPVNPAQLLDEITHTILRFIVLDKHQAQAAALWVAACWFVDVIQCAPIALINAPERACGKTQLLTVLAKLAPRTAQASGISPSVLFRMVEAYKPTLFIDEIETVLKDNEELRGLINAGHTRDSAFVWRSVAKGDDFEPKRFNVWGMKAVAGINAINLAETVTSRAIVIQLRRKRPDEKVERLRHAEPDFFTVIASKLARFADDYTQQVADMRPNIPAALGDRDQDNWEPLMQVACIAGDHWPETVKKIALELSSAVQTPVSNANELLADIQEIFETKQVVKISTANLISALCEDTEKSWATYNRGKPLSSRQLASKLKDYEITSKTIRIDAYETAKGFYADQFKDAFSRYIFQHPRNLPSQGNILLEASIDVPSSVTHENSVTLTKSNSVTDRKNVTVTDFDDVTLDPSIGAACDVVTDKKAFLGGGAEINIDNNSMEF